MMSGRISSFQGERDTEPVMEMGERGIYGTQARSSTPGNQQIPQICNRGRIFSHAFPRPLSSLYFINSGII